MIECERLQGAAPPYIQTAKRMIVAHIRGSRALRFKSADDRLETLRKVNSDEKVFDADGNEDKEAQHKLRRNLT